MEKELIYDVNEAVDFIQKKLKLNRNVEATKGAIKEILEADEDYMRTKGIIEN